MGAKLKLTDTFGRVHNYLRISLTPHCNLRCFYCMPDDDYTAPLSTQLMQTTEIIALAKLFVSLGVDKIRLTGGEPLIRKDITSLLEQLARLDVQLAISTNGVRLHHVLPTLITTGIRSINVSLDTLQPEKFAFITKRDVFHQVWDNIQRLLDHQIHVKLNVVVMKGMNDTEINDFVALTKDMPLHVRFIEFMPFDGNNWNRDKVFGWQQILQTVEQAYDFYHLNPAANDTAKSYQVFNHTGTFAVISTMTAPFCSTCNRMRLTADGKMKNCLFSRNETDLLTALRRGDDVEALIRQCIHEKAAATGGQFTQALEQIDITTLQNRSMTAIGG